MDYMSPYLLVYGVEVMLGTDGAAVVVGFGVWLGATVMGILIGIEGTGVSLGN
jgi:hypothetical protein